MEKTVLDLSDLDIEELENRLEMASAMLTQDPTNGNSVSVGVRVRW